VYPVGVLYAEDLEVITSFKALM